MCIGAARSARITSGQAAKLRGYAAWLDSSLAGRCMRGAMRALIARQHWGKGERVVPDSVLHRALLHIAAAATHVPDRALMLARPCEPPIAVYSDAAEDRARVRLGAKVVMPNGKVHITIWDAMPAALATWGPQATKINQAELHCGIKVATAFPELLRGRDVLWWIDNASAATSMVKAGSPTEGVGRLALKAHAMLAASDASL
ncbi:unnamed protein product [Prorocentrum cordatum]|uniref:Uncharacterized protein n=1 Tax=Prorocentrum cordatum TaxID=2364126 RepID=A0ABN9PTJ8_9DINO|nr:unnamed protein product [Polarella glacialis]